MSAAPLFRRCIVCFDAFLPRGSTHRLCRRCFAWHRFGLAVAEFARRPNRLAP
ncbi:MAG: hypothetical protein M3R31_08695 [Pseudomonadota bacterium]|nr:hypothetical protein [Pseudomonadota bacterium]